MLAIGVGVEFAECLCWIDVLGLKIRRGNLKVSIPPNFLSLTMFLSLFLQAQGELFPYQKIAEYGILLLIGGFIIRYLLKKIDKMETAHAAAIQAKDNEIATLNAQLYASLEKFGEEYRKAGERMTDKFSEAVQEDNDRVQAELQKMRQEFFKK